MEFEQFHFLWICTGRHRSAVIIFESEASLQNVVGFWSQVEILLSDLTRLQQQTLRVLRF